MKNGVGIHEAKQDSESIAALREITIGTSASDSEVKKKRRAQKLDFFNEIFFPESSDWQHVNMSTEFD